MKTKKVSILILGSILTITALGGCGSSKATTTTKSNTAVKKQVVKIGITGDDHNVWDKVKVTLAKENIDLQLVSFADYIRPNIALSE